MDRSCRALALLLAALAGCLVLACGPPGRAEETWESLGAPAAAEVYARTRPDAEAAVQEIRERVDRAMRELAPRGEGGEVARLNREASEGFYEVRNGDVYRCLKLALDYARESGGAYDPTLGALVRLYRTRAEAGPLPSSKEIDLALARVGWEKVTLAPETFAVRFRAPGMSIDLGQVGCGCALDWAARIFARPGMLAGLLRLGGAYRAWARPPGGEPWVVPLLDPRDPERELLRVRVSGRGLAVAGHPPPAAGGRPPPEAPLFLDPHTGRPAAGDVAAAVAVADSAADAAALAHALLVAGSLRGPSFLARMHRAEAVLLVRGEGESSYLLASASLEGRIELSDELRRETGGDVRYLLPPESL